MIPVPNVDAQRFFAKLETAITNNDRKTASRTMEDLADLGYYIQIMIRHVARNGDRLEINSNFVQSVMTVNGVQHGPTVLKYKGLLERLDAHPEEYDVHFYHRNDLSPEDDAWLRIDPSQGGRFDDSKYR